MAEPASSECAVIYRELFRRDWAEDDQRDWQAWLAHTREEERAALAALDAVKRNDPAASKKLAAFCAKYPSRPARETRRGLRAEHVIDETSFVARIYLDPETMPEDAPVEMRSAGPVLVHEYRPTSKLFLPTDGAHYTLVGRPAPDANVVHLSFTLTADSTIHGIVARALRARLAASGAMGAFQPLLAKLPGPRQRRHWTPRFAVLTRFDRDYAPGELHVRRGHRPRRDRLTRTELAAISLLAGSPLGISRWQTIGDALNREASYLDGVCDQVEAYRKAGVPIPRMFPSEVMLSA